MWFFHFITGCRWARAPARFADLALSQMKIYVKIFGFISAYTLKLMLQCNIAHRATLVTHIYMLEHKDAEIVLLWSLKLRNISDCCIISQQEDSSSIC